MYTNPDSASLYYLGSLPIKHFQDSSKEYQVKSNEERAIDYVETEQMLGKFRTDSQGCSKVNLQVSKYGVKMVDAIDGRVIERFPLIDCMMSVSYEDSIGRYNVILVERQKLGSRVEGAYTCHVLQSVHRNEADGACKLFESVFRTAMQASHTGQIADSPN